MPRRTMEESLKTKESILDVAIAEGARRGFEALPLEEVAEAAGVTRGAVYHHFGSRQGLLRAATERMLEEMELAIEAAAAAAEGPWESLEAGCLAFVRRAQSPAYQQIVLTDAPALLGLSTWQAMDDHYTTSSLVEALHELEGQGVIFTANVSATAEALSGAMNHLARWAGSKNNLQVAEQVLLQLLGSLRA